LEFRAEALQFLKISLHLHLLGFESPLFLGLDCLIVLFKLFSAVIDAFDYLVEEGVYLV
jgi:hypothetical protein